ncbi:AraC-type DNA-binding protein [Fodinibius salinus]|uniref:AraC-type DNA-binding protein n=1 Tax=Fodinibius salinus TaxID=860790 RepID=A0A5D3YIE9_9BACT|nr:AraC family transcriptional regulator [Fodinibius salinus]TYP93624.1 AraC-type DNA-binding protein [Fodinibius salinus]
MNKQRQLASIGEALSILQDEVCHIITVQYWAQAVGYECSKKFSNVFRNEFGKRPQPVLISFRTRKAIALVRKSNLSNYEIAQKLKLRNEKGLYQFVKEQTGHSPTAIQNMVASDYQRLQKRLCNKISE